jgi:hypothetical protein
MIYTTEEGFGISVFQNQDSLTFLKEMLGLVISKPFSVVYISNLGLMHPKLE